MGRAGRIIAVVVSFGLAVTVGIQAQAAAPPPQNPVSGSTGLQGTIPSAPPKTGATITTPGNGQVFTTTPITVAGLCPAGLLVKLFTNNVFVGAAECASGSYSIQIDLFGGHNDLVARVFDALDQPGPDSNIVGVTFNDSQFNHSNDLLLLTSNYARRGANPGEILAWPIILSGGTGPYALTVNWGDGKAADLLSQEFPGTIELHHVYDSAGVYTITIRATDKNGLIAFLQLVGVANGAVTASSNSKSADTNRPALVKVLWLPAATTLLLLPITFWLGRRYELSALRKHLE